MPRKSRLSRAYMRYLRERKFWKERRKQRLLQKLREKEASPDRTGPEVPLPSSDDSDSDGRDVVPATDKLLDYVESSDDDDDASSTGSEDTVYAMASKLHGQQGGANDASATRTAKAAGTSAKDQPGTSKALAQGANGKSAANATVSVTQHYQENEEQTPQEPVPFSGHPPRRGK